MKIKLPFKLGYIYFGYERHFEFKAYSAYLKTTGLADKWRAQYEVGYLTPELTAESHQSTQDPSESPPSPQDEGSESP